MPELPRDDYTRFIQSLTCNSEPINPATADDLIEGISRGVELEEHPVFLEGLSARLTELGVSCKSTDIDIMQPVYYRISGNTLHFATLIHHVSLIIASKHQQ